MTDYQTPISLYGPTAAGKTSVAISLAQQLGGVIINADSLQVYDDCATLTARPDEEEMAAADHRLYGFLSAGEGMDVASWLRLARHEMQQIQAEGKLPIFCGGTGFYLKALEEGISTIPVPSEGRLNEAKNKLEALGMLEFEAEVYRFDPKLIGRFEVGDAQRLLRAWSVFKDTGKPLSYWQQQPKVGGVGALNSFVLLPNREALYGRINARFQNMLDRGALEEVASVARRYTHPDKIPISQALGFKELLAVTRGRCSIDEALESGSKLSRNYAKRQLTWARNQTKSAIKLPYMPHIAQYNENLSDLIISFVSQKS